MKSLNHMLMLTACVVLTGTAVWGQTADDPTSALVRGLHHRRTEVREASLEALLQQARAGKDLSEARSDLLDFANLKFQSQYPEHVALEYQQAALKILVTIDETIAQKVLDRTTVLVDAYEKIKTTSYATNTSAVSELWHRLPDAFVVLASVTTQDHRQQAAELARRVLRADPKAEREAEVLLPVVYNSLDTAGERIQATRELGIAWQSVALRSLFPAIYNAPQIDDAAVRFLTNLDPGHDNRQAYLLGVLSPRSDKAKQAALQLMRDDYESRGVRHAAASGLIMTHDPEDPLYWEADTIVAENGGGNPHRSLDLGPQFDVGKHNQLKREKREQQQAAERDARRAQQTAQQASTARPETTQTSFPTKANIEDMQAFQAILLRLRKEIRPMVKGEAVVLRLPQTAIDELEQESNRAKTNGRPGLAQHIDATLKAWKDMADQGRMIIVEK